MNRRIARSPLGRAAKAVTKRFDHWAEAARDDPVDLAAGLA